MRNKTISTIRYVEGNFVIWDHDLQSLNNFSINVNESDSRVKLTLKIEKEGVLPFLYSYKNKSNRSVFMTQSTSRNPISFESNSTFPYKIAAYREIDLNKQIGTHNGLPPQYINRLLDRTKLARGKNE